MSELLQFTQLQTQYEWILLSLIALVVFGLPKLFGLNFFNGLIVAQIMSIINSVPIIVGYVTGYLPLERIFHFYWTESFFLLMMIFIYSKIIKMALPEKDNIIRFFGRNSLYLLISITVILAVLALIFTPQDGSSRIQYQTNYWYSFVKPISQIALPVAYFASFVSLLSSRSRVLAAILILCTIAVSTFSGSKGVFVLFSLTSLLAVRDLKMTPKLHLRVIDVSGIVIVMIAGVAFTLDRLRLTIDDIFDRIVLFSEPTLLVYYAGNPTAACSSLSTFAKIHRGWARAAGDASASNIDTLFGYAWTIYYIGVNTFTGPNARFSSYLICNFPGYQVVIALAVTLFYFFLNFWVIKLSTNRGVLLALLFPVTLFSITAAGQDYNVLMQDVNYLLLFAFILLLRRPLSKTGSIHATFTDQKA